VLQFGKVEGDTFTMDFAHPHQAGMSTSRGKDTVSPLDGQCLDSLMEVRPSLNERVENMEASDASDLPVIILPGPNQATLEQAVRALGRGQGGWVILRKVKEGETQETRLFVEPLAAQSSTRFEAIGDWFLSLLELDLRSLALARFLVGLVFFWDLWVRSRSLVAHYTDNGALPRQTLIEIGMPKVAFSLLLLNGLESWAWAVFALGFCAAVSLAVGFRSRTSCLLCWIVSVSLQVRFPDLLNSGDVLMSIVLFLLSQLPIGDCLSIDAALSPLKPPYTRFVSASTAALLVEFAIIYVSAALTKTGNLWKNGQAIYYAMNIVGISRDPGAGILSDLVVSYPELAQPLTVAVVYFEGIAPLFLFWPFHTLRGPVRVCLVLLFCAMHIAFHITLNLHVFALLSCALWTALLPAWFWDKMRHHTQSVEALCDRLPRLRRVVRIPPSSRPRRNTSHILMRSPRPHSRLHHLAISQLPRHRPQWVCDDHLDLPLSVSLVCVSRCVSVLMCLSLSLCGVLGETRIGRGIGSGDGSSVALLCRTRYAQDTRHLCETLQ